MRDDREIFVPASTVSGSISGPPQGGSGVPNGAGASPPTVTRPYGIDTSTAGSLQEKYFMVLAGLMQKSLELNREILDQLILMNKSLAPKVTEINVDRTLEGVPGSRQGKRNR